jgi:hypothetical protein
MKNITKLATFAFVSLVPAVAFAGKGGISANARVDVIPVGTLAAGDGDTEISTDMALAYGVGAQVDYWVTDQISVGLAPRYILNVIADEADDDADAAAELDIAVRAAYNHAVNPQLTAYGFLAPGYSIIMLPEQEGVEIDDPAGLIIGFGAGARYGINDKLFAQGELGYQLGMQKIEDSDFTASFLHIGVGIGSHF